MTPPALGADLRALLVASCLRGALPPVDLRAVCFVLAILTIELAYEKGNKQTNKQKVIYIYIIYIYIYELSAEQMKPGGRWC